MNSFIISSAKYNQLIGCFLLCACVSFLWHVAFPFFWFSLFLLTPISYLPGALLSYLTYINNVSFHIFLHFDINLRAVGAFFIDLQKWNPVIYTWYVAFLTLLCIDGGYPPKSTEAALIHSFQCLTEEDMSQIFNHFLNDMHWISQSCFPFLFLSLWKMWLF